MPNPEEVATITVDGQKFEDWTTVFVQHRWADPFPIFRFTAAERDMRPMQFKPGQNCEITLGGQKAITGIILARQVAYDAYRHGVQLSGVGKTWSASRASIIDKTGNYDGKNFETIAREICKDLDQEIEVIGEIDQDPLRDVQVEPGQTVWDNLERIGRPFGVIMGSDHEGKLLLIGKHEKQSVADLIEGKNIKRCQCVISIENTYYDFRMRGQCNGSDGKNMTEASEQEVETKGTLEQKSPLLITAYQPVYDIEKLRNQLDNEAKWNEGTIIEANITVVGWLRGGGSLWVAGDEVLVRSPMAMLNDQQLKIALATFTQTNESGTETTLTLKAPWLLNGKYDARVGGALTNAPPRSS